MKFTQPLLDSAEDWIAQHGLIEYGGGQLQDFCAYLGINDRTYRRWLERKEFRSVIERGREVYKLNLTHELHETLAMAAKGGEHEEVTTEFRPNAKNNDKPTIVKMTKKKTFVPPNVGAAIFLLTNLDPAHYQNKQKNDIVLGTQSENDMTLEQINAEIERLKR
jgi:hypothetical protein